ncbi:hypothetical protein [Companilactobacillus ginsenosidimutans]|uniref:Uncharacterized protein n=1 Tax=Companilactobacillus ginsenosidimutans TaxID=1007676 RepID=A0A0H4QJK2_9LACO|nr:hypothetical protein [Companilactobacillus ginsenosidimutans]AKP68107.1 hypothetical protein ABM34_11555 [Companilactobacillus ginsenosidimutans]
MIIVNKLFITLLISNLVIFGVVLVKQALPVKADVISQPESTANPYYQKPSEYIPYSQLSGFSTQPHDMNTFLNNSVDIKPKFDLTFLDRAGHTKTTYQWYESKDKYNWKPMMGQNDINLSVTPKSTGIMYYQLELTNYYHVMFIVDRSVSFYTNVVKVRTSSVPISATSAEVKFDSNYLYNQPNVHSVSHAVAELQPSGAVANLVSWEIDKERLATINASTGEITANNDGQTGRATVTVRYINNSGDTIIGKNDIFVGGGLDDQTVKQFQPVTFRIHWNPENPPDSIKWYKILPNSKDGKEIPISNDDNLDFSQSDIQLSDDGTEYYAIMTFSKPNSDTPALQITTNKAKVHVVQRNPLEVFIRDLQQGEISGQFEQQTVNNVSEGDKLSINGTILKGNTDGGMLYFKIPLLSKNVILRINGEKVKPKSGNIVDQKYSYVRLDDIKFGENHYLNFELEFIPIYKSLAKFKPFVQFYRDRSFEKELMINFSKNQDNEITNSINISPKDFNFGRAISDSKNQLLECEHSGDIFEGVSISDSRIKRSYTRLMVKEKTPFHKGSTSLNTELKFFGDNGEIKSQETDGDLEVEHSEANIPLSSLKWKKGQGLKLLLHDNKMSTGTYSAQLEWTITEGP